MHIDSGMITHLEELSHLCLSPEERVRIRETLGDILEYMSILEELCTDSVQAPPPHVAVAGGLRPDTVIPSFDRQRMLASAPSQQDGYFQAPGTMEG